ncbi:hypothetical protein D915_006864 [Fasciola hepatica]|uniref:Uncharacterized protein n=1 Tax=Fasciola hepatica TaxID=6192 RepID=A0A4E0RPB9_FASHE|nr:hypothetical protein D915_006864 [Fasciola hepatica]
MFDSLQILENIRQNLCNETEEQGSMFLTLKTANDKLMNGINRAEQLMRTEAWTLSSFMQTQRRNCGKYALDRIQSPIMTNRTLSAVDTNENNPIQELCSRIDCALDKRLLKLETRLDCLTQLDRGCCAHGIWRCSDCKSLSSTPRQPRPQLVYKHLDTVGVQTPRSMLHLDLYGEQLQGNKVKNSDGQKSTRSVRMEKKCEKEWNKSELLKVSPTEKPNQSGEQTDRTNLSSQASRPSRNRTLSICTSTESIPTLVDGEFHGTGEKSVGIAMQDEHKLHTPNSDRPPRLDNPSSGRRQSSGTKGSGQRQLINSISVPPISGLSSASSTERRQRRLRRNSLESSYETIYDAVLKPKNASARSLNWSEVVSQSTNAKVCDYL